LTNQQGIDNAEIAFRLTSPAGSDTTANHVAISSYKVDAVVTADINYHLIDTLDGLLTITFPTGFTVLTAATGGSSCLDTFGFTTSTLTAQKHGCHGDVTLTGATVQNPHEPGIYVVSWINDLPGNSAIYITQEDQVSVTAAVDPVLTFNVGAQDATAVNCDGTFSGNGGTLALGTLGTGTVTSSDVAGIQHICTRITTNATHGAVVSVKSANASLKSISVPGDLIPSVSADMTSGTANYGLCAGDRFGEDLTEPVGGNLSQATPFDGTCADDTADGHVGGLTTGAQAVWSIDAPVQNAYQNLVLKATISPTTKAHSDYADTLTFVATGTF
jgi:hypothetical protein